MNIHGKLVRAAIMAPTLPDTSDGYHTFRELYAHRHALFLLLLKVLSDHPTAQPWWSRKHHLGGAPMYDGYVVAGIELPNGPITYHLPDTYVPHLQATGIREERNAPQWDGHTSSDVVNRLLYAVNDGKPL